MSPLLFHTRRLEFHERALGYARHSIDILWHSEMIDFHRRRLNELRN